MTERELNEKIRQAYTHAAPDVLDAVLSDCGTQKGSVQKMTLNHKKNKTWALRLAGLAACLCLILGGGFGLHSYRVNHTVDATVSLDVNPSVEIRVNKKERVLEVNPLNEDGKVIVGDMDLSGSDVDVAVNAMIGSMLKSGYLNELANSILISVDNEDTARGAALQERLSAEVSKLLQTETFSGAVLSQTVVEDDDLRQLADKNGITVGKAQLIRDIIAEKPLHTFEELAPLTINELNLLRANATGTGRVESTGTASAKAYIGQDKAKEIAVSKAGVSASALTELEIEMDTSDGVMVYEVEFKAGGYEYDYEINASTGAVLKGEKETDDDAASKPASSTDTKPSAGVIGEAKAKTAALKHAGVSATAIREYECQLDTEDGVRVYEIEFKAGNYEYDYEINASTGAVLKGEKETDDDAVSKPTLPTDTKPSAGVIGEAKAKTAALKHAGVSATAIREYECQLDTEDGVRVYEIEFKAGNYEYNYEINASTGAVLKGEKETDDDAVSKSALSMDTKPSAGVIGEAKAKTAALKHAGVSATAIREYECQLDTEDGVRVYEIEFKAGNYEYSYEINASTGTVLMGERELDD